MGTGERSSMPTVVLRLCGHPAMGPKPVSDQLQRRMSVPISPPPKQKLLLFAELAMRAWNPNQNAFLYEKTLWHTSARAAVSAKSVLDQSRGFDYLTATSALSDRAGMSETSMSEKCECRTSQSAPR
jgi:hypothetical protein